MAQYTQYTTRTKKSTVKITSIGLEFKLQKLKSYRSNLKTSVLKFVFLNLSQAVSGKLNK